MSPGTLTSATPVPSFPRPLAFIRALRVLSWCLAFRGERVGARTGCQVGAGDVAAKWDRLIDARFAPSKDKTFRVPRDAPQPVTEVNLLEW